MVDNKQKEYLTRCEKCNDYFYDGQNIKKCNTCK